MRTGNPQSFRGRCQITSRLIQLIRRPQPATIETCDISEVSDTQQEGYLHNIKGKLVGFWTSELYGHISVHGFHFIDEKQQISGHVLFYHAEEAIVSYEESRP
ncbi:acetolactate decarboxylase [Erwinia tracheiphila]|uniref:Uncharacterized protein n=1 Tax=Erwinia tracheiphila TaxID=65700 RepID=A0A345CP38_9GAMM|nr:hypothetical protein AV903_02300 [Erwinia tracheiphila]